MRPLPGISLGPEQRPGPGPGRAHRGHGGERVGGERVGGEQGAGRERRDEPGLHHRDRHHPRLIANARQMARPAAMPSGIPAATATTATVVASHCRRNPAAKTSQTALIVPSRQ